MAEKKKNIKKQKTTKRGGSTVKQSVNIKIVHGGAGAKKKAAKRRSLGGGGGGGPRPSGGYILSQPPIVHTPSQSLFSNPEERQLLIENIAQKSLEYSKKPPLLLKDGPSRTEYKTIDYTNFPTAPSTPEVVNIPISGGPIIEEVKAKRGRPLGSKNKPKMEADPNDPTVFHPVSKPVNKPVESKLPVPDLDFWPNIPGSVATQYNIV